MVACAGMAACAPAYRNPPVATAPADSAPAATTAATDRPTPGGPITIVGRVDGDGAFRADTLPGVRPDTTRVERETVLTGAVRSPAELPRAALLVTGYRVQVFAAEDQASAGAAAGRVRESAGDAPVYVERDEPWYKVRVGDFASREAAEPLRRRLIEAGFVEAWTVQTTIRTVP